MAMVYIETSIVSYLRQRPCSEIVMAARQLLTHRWWNNERTKYELVLSQDVIEEAQVLADMNIPIPMICTPEELLGDDTETES